MINAGEVNNRFATYIEQNNLRLSNLENKFEDLGLQMQDLQAPLKIIMDKLGIQHNPPHVGPLSLAQHHLIVKRM